MPAIANAFCAFVRLVERGKEELAYGNRHYWGGSQYGSPYYGYGTRWGW